VRRTRPDPGPLRRPHPGLRDGHRPHRPPPRRWHDVHGRLTSTNVVGLEDALLQLPLRYSLALRLRDAGIAPEVISAYVDVPLGALEIHFRLAELKLRAAQGFLRTH
jgi:DNA-directed RNA polymerase specialized sigma24 family protein